MSADRSRKRAAGGPSWKIALVLAASACSGGMSREEVAAFSNCARDGDWRLQCLAEQGGVAACRRAAVTMSVPGCFSVFAKAERNVAFCDEIATPDDRAKCLSGVAETTKDARVCARIEQLRVRDECVQRVAIFAARDVSVCDLVGNPYRRDTCREGNHCFLGTACPHIEDVYRRDACYLDAVKSAKGSIDLCDKVVASKAKCLVEAAKNHPEVCERVGSSPSSISRTRCYDVAFTHLQQSSACSGIENPAPLRECETQLALHANDSTTCTAMRTSEGADSCWNTLARSDGLSCLKIQRSFLQHDCLRRYWGKTNNARICSSLTPVALVRACRAHFRSKAGREAQ